MIVALVVVLPLVLGFALAARPEPPGAIPAGLFGEPERPDGEPIVRTDWRELAIEIAHWPLVLGASRTETTPRPIVAFTMLEDPGLPDLLVYQHDQDGVPVDGVLLGPLPRTGTRRFELTDEGPERDWLVIWSQTDERVVDALQLTSD